MVLGITFQESTIPEAMATSGSQRQMMCNLYPLGDRWIWRQNILANIQFFLWQVAHDSIPTRVVLNHWGCSM